ncbi:Eukaryotic peptide chain release factor subunit [Dirofilaria immitis]
MRHSRCAEIPNPNGRCCIKCRRKITNVLANALLYHYASHNQIVLQCHEASESDFGQQTIKVQMQVHFYFHII